jgi:hypothetical protein
VKALIDRVGHAVVVEAIASWRLVRLPLARHLARLFKVYDIRCVLDVGANTGQYRDFLRREVGFDGLVISFEPISSVFQALAERASSDLQWKVLNLALGAVDEERVLNVMAASDLSSLLQPKTTGPQFRHNVMVSQES